MEVRSSFFYLFQLLAVCLFIHFSYSRLCSLHFAQSQSPQMASGITLPYASMCVSFFALPLVAQPTTS